MAAAHTRRMDRLPLARMVPDVRFARVRATASRSARAMRRSWPRVARQVIVLALTVVGFAAILGVTLLLARGAISDYDHAWTAPPPRPMTIFVAHPSSPARAVGAAMATLGATQSEALSRGTAIEPQ